MKLLARITSSQAPKAVLLIRLMVGAVWLNWPACFTGFTLQLQVKRDRLPAGFFLRRQLNDRLGKCSLDQDLRRRFCGHRDREAGLQLQSALPRSPIADGAGLTVLASMIVGFDYQNQQVVAQELDGLLKLKPALSQFLIYGPVPGTPFYERVIKENLLQDVFTKDPDLYYRSADGFTTMIKHPMLSPEAIEDIQRWCFAEDYRRLGPSIFRALETRFLGYQTLKNSPNPRLRAKAGRFAADLRAAYPVFLAGRLFGPNAAVRHWIGDLERRLHAELGRPAVGEKLKATLAVGAALWTGLILKLNPFQHAKLTRTPYRLPSKRWSAFDLWEKFHREASMRRHLRSLHPKLTRRARLAYVVGDQLSFLMVPVATAKLLSAVAEAEGYKTVGCDLWRERVGTKVRNSLTNEKTVRIREEILLLERARS